MNIVHNFKLPCFFNSHSVNVAYIGPNAWPFMTPTRSLQFDFAFECIVASFMGRKFKKIEIIDKANAILLLL